MPKYKAKLERNKDQNGRRRDILIQTSKVLYVIFGVESTNEYVFPSFFCLFFLMIILTCDYCTYDKATSHFLSVLRYVIQFLIRPHKNGNPPSRRISAGIQRIDSFDSPFLLTYFRSINTTNNLCRLSDIFLCCFVDFLKPVSAQTHTSILADFYCSFILFL